MMRMTIETAITSAIEGGWSWKGLEMSAEDTLHDYEFSLEETLLDPKFWQALGKTRGWDEGKKYVDSKCRYDSCVDESEEWEYFKKENPEDAAILEEEGEIDNFDDAITLRLTKSAPEWRTKMHRMIDALAEGKTLDEYFASL